MKKIWAPWRMEYILKAIEEKDDSCFFCTGIEEKNDRKNLILYRSSLAFVMLNRFPYNNGHLMVVPYRHNGDFLKLSRYEKADLSDLLQLSVQVLIDLMQPEGFNIGMNLGRVAGAGVADHLHYHIVPRWDGDTNFMPVISDTKVISEALEASYDKLHSAFLQRTGEK